MIVRFFGRSVPEHFSGFQDGFDTGGALSTIDAPGADMRSVLLRHRGPRWRPAPDLWRLSVDSIFHHNRGFFAKGCSLLLQLLQHVDDVLRRPVVKSVPRTPVTVAEL